MLDKARDIAKSYGVSLERNTLVVDFTDEGAGDEMHRLIQSILAVTHLIQGRRTGSRVVFNDEVESFIIQTGVTYDSDYRIRGLREAHTFKFHVNSAANLSNSTAVCRQRSGCPCRRRAVGLSVH